MCSSLQIGVYIAADALVCVSGNSRPETAGDRKACKCGSKLTFRKWYLSNFPLFATLISSLYISQMCGLCGSCYAQAFLCSSWTECMLGVWVSISRHGNAWCWKANGLLKGKHCSKFVTWEVIEGHCLQYWRITRRCGSVSPRSSASQEPHPFLILYSILWL